MKKKKSTKKEFCFIFIGKFTQDEFILESSVIGLKDLTPDQFRTFLMAYIEFQNENIFPEVLRRRIPGLDMTGQEVLNRLGLGEKEDVSSMH